MAIWTTRPVDEIPEIQLINWDVRELPDGDRHFVGWNIVEMEGRVSSKIVTFDQRYMTGVTQSGRVYQLLRAPGTDSDAEYVWQAWCRINGVELATVKSVAKELYDHPDRFGSTDEAEVTGPKSLAEMLSPPEVENQEYTIKPEYLTSSPVEYGWKGYNDAPCSTTTWVDHPSFAALREHLGARGYIEIQRGWWNGDRVTKRFKLNGHQFEVGEQFGSGSATGNTFQAREKRN
jgi:hypothetical protein